MTVAAMNLEVLTKPTLSKAELAFSLSKNESDSEGSLGHILEPLTETMTREDLIEYAVLLKMNGMSGLEISTKIPRGPSWIKKYVNPIVAKATKELEGVTSASPGDTLQLAHVGSHSHDLFNFGIANLEKETRQFGGWGSVEVKDSQKDKLPTDALEKIMPTYMKRGSPIMFGHSNRHVGKVLKFEFKPKEVDGKQIPGLWLEGQIFKDYKIDDEAWKAIKLAQANGKPVLSLGATPIGSPSYECDGQECFRKFDDLQLFEFTVTDLASGQQGANPEATIEMAKAADTENADEELALADGDLFKAFPYEWTLQDCAKFIKKNAQQTCQAMKRKGGWWDRQPKSPASFRMKPSEADRRALREQQARQGKKRRRFFGKSDDAEGSNLDNVWLAGRLLKMKKDGTLPTDAMALVDLQLASCADCEEEFESLLKEGKSEAEAKAILFKEMSEAMQSLEKELDEMATEGEDQEISKEDFGTFLQAIMKSQEQIIALLSKEEPPEEEEEEEEKQDEVPPPPKKEEEEEEEEKADEDKPEDEKDPALTLSKFNITLEQLEEINKQMGYQKVGTSPAPGLASRDLTKGTEEKKAPSLEVQIEAVRTGDLSLLEE